MEDLTFERKSPGTGSYLLTVLPGGQFQANPNPPVSVGEESTLSPPGGPSASFCEPTSTAFSSNLPPLISALPPTGPPVFPCKHSPHPAWSWKDPSDPPECILCTFEQEVKPIVNIHKYVHHVFLLTEQVRQKTCVYPEYGMCAAGEDDEKDNNNNYMLKPVKPCRCLIGSLGLIWGYPRYLRHHRIRLINFLDRLRAVAVQELEWNKKNHTNTNMSSPSKNECSALAIFRASNDFEAFMTAKYTTTYPYTSYIHAVDPSQTQWCYSSRGSR